MEKKIAVLGYKADFKYFMRCLEDSMQAEIIYIKPINSIYSIDLIAGVELSNIILLEGWSSAYENPGELLRILETRIR